MSRLGDFREALGDWIDDVALRSPARLAMSVFATVILIFTGLLSLPWATASGERADFADALFTATSAVCVTGLTTVDTGVYWSDFGRVVILLGIKVGGLGIMTLASILGLAVSRRLGLTQRMLAADEARAGGLGDVKQLLRTIIIVSTGVEVIIALILFPRFVIDGLPILTSAWHAVFYAVSAFNNAGFVPNPTGIVEYAGDPWVSGPIAIGVFIGALGFPVYLNLIRAWKTPRMWSLHTKLTLVMVVILSFVSAGLLALFEWNNPNSLGPENLGTKLITVFFGSINQRSGGFAAISHEGMYEHTWLLEEVLMFIGGGSGGTAGGIRVTTLAVLVLAVAAEARGRRDIEAFGKRIGTETLRLAVAVTLVGLTFVLIGAGLMLAWTAHLGWTLDKVLFQVVSAYATCGLSVLSGDEIAEMPDAVKHLTSVLMFAGRLGSVTIAAALALNKQRRVIRYPSERPLIG
ncbi:TrkH family potassium uptake protein [Demequina zhanjiangensis]|uniref:Potassium transporter TrkG n=1 Tax=Demequina zhanjiangensis TaxID=3051659 RepID=A0ABT8FY53_9MICO|nr:potassium transporter TrkG [Demequina sp. SYSU T00b26]MDN4471379.1 potassium transporter TrkG [Demequina sp. SYSU T00b26]